MSTRVIRLELAMTPALARNGLAAAILVFGTAPLVCESLTMSTYYPSPLGVYKQLITTGGTAGGTAYHTVLARDNANSNVGIGVSNPLRKLEVGGGVAIGSGYAGVDFGANNPPADSLIVSGKVGIGSTSPQASIDVNGNANVATDLNLTSNSSVFRMGSASSWTITTDGVDQFNITTNNGPRVRLLDSNSPAAGATLLGTLWGDRVPGAITLSNNAGQSVFTANASSTTVSYAGNPILRSDGNFTSVGVAGSTPLTVYATGAQRAETPGYFYAQQTSGCVTRNANQSCPVGYYATFTQGFKALGYSIQSRPTFPSNLYTWQPGCTSSAYCGPSNNSISPVTIDYNSVTFYCCPN